MEGVYRQGAVGALLDEYEKAISELKRCIESIPDKDLTHVVDTITTDLNCRSVQTILSHVVSAAYGYAIYVQKPNRNNFVRPDKTVHFTVKEYIRDLTEVFRFTTTVFEDIKDDELEQSDYSAKIPTSWGQVYDIEQMIEHAIVHVLRHRRQIEKFKIALHKF